MRIAWAITGAGHFLADCVDVLSGLPDVARGDYDRLVLAPATGNSAAKFAHGIAGHHREVDG